MIKAYPMHNINLSSDCFRKALGGIFCRQRLAKTCFVKEFEEKFSSYIGAQYSIGVSSARLGLYLLFKALNFTKGDEIILSAYNYYVIPGIASMLGLKPVFVDIEESSYNINHFLIKGRITDKTRAIVVTHMFGQPCNMDIILETCAKYNLILIEDCAHACGASYRNKKVGLFGDASVFSFDLGKNISCFGGGIITVKNTNLYERIKMVAKNYPPLPNTVVLNRILLAGIYFILLRKNIFPFLLYPVLRLFDYLGLNLIKLIVRKHNLESYNLSKRYKGLLNEMQARVGVVQLEKLNKINSCLMENAKKLNNFLCSAGNIKIPKCDTKNACHIYSNYRIQVKNRDLFIKKLLRRGIFAFVDDNIVAYSEANYPSKVAQKVSQRSLEIPNYISLNESNIRYIAEQVKSVDREVNRGDYGG